MTVVKGTTRSKPIPSKSPVLPTLEERLHRSRDWFVLAAEIFELRSVAPEYLQADLPSPSGCRAATAMCLRGAAEMRLLLDTLPSEIKDWAPPDEGQGKDLRKRP